MQIKDRQLKIFSILSLLFLNLLFVYCSPIVAQNSEELNKSSESLKESLKEDAQIESVERLIQVDKTTSDIKIKSLLKSILESSKKYTELDINVDDGLVFLEGQTKDPNYIKWASDIAKNINGVIAVVNNINTEKSGYFTAKPIKTELLKVWFKTLEVLPLIAVGIIAFFTFFFLSKPISSLLTRPIGYLTDSELIKIVLKRVLSIFVILVGFYFFLRIAGLTQFALAVMSGTGIIGLIVGFAFRDIAENFISSLLISVQRPFRLGDVIQVEGYRGVVRKVTARGTTLVDYDGNHIQIPNAIIYKNIIQNFTANPNVRNCFIVGIGYDASIQQAQELAMKIMLEQEAVLNTPEPQILVDNLGSSTINLKVYFWIDSHTYSSAKVASILMREIIRKFESEKISMPDDAREIIFPQGVPVIQTTNAALNQEINEKIAASNKVSQTNIKHETQIPINDLSSDTDDIQRQAEKARDPEEGDSIL